MVKSDKQAGTQTGHDSSHSESAIPLGFIPQTTDEIKALQNKLKNDYQLTVAPELYYRKESLLKSWWKRFWL